MTEEKKVVTPAAGFVEQAVQALIEANTKAEQAQAQATERYRGEADEQLKRLALKNLESVITLGKQKIASAEAVLGLSEVQARADQARLQASERYRDETDDELKRLALNNLNSVITSGVQNVASAQAAIDDLRAQHAKPMLSTTHQDLLQVALATFRESGNTTRTSVAGAQVVQRQFASAYEDNCSTLIVKALHNAGASISSRYRNDIDEMTDPKALKAIRKAQLSPDFYARRVGISNDLHGKFIPCFMSTQSLEHPASESERDLPTPPQSPVIRPEEQFSVVFEYTLDSDRWEGKLQQLENYVGYISAANEAIGIAGIVLPSPERFESVAQALNNPAQYPKLSKLHKSGCFYYVVCDSTFIKDTVSVTSSNTYQVKKNGALLMALVQILAGEGEK